MKTQASPEQIKTQTVIGLFFMGIMLCGLLVMLYLDLGRKYELYAHGKMATGTVASVFQTTERRSTGKNSHKTVTVYDHLIRYDGHSKTFRLDYTYSQGAAVEIYYSARDPDTAMVRQENQPYASALDFLLEPVPAILLVFTAFSLGSFIFLLRLRAEQRRAAETAV